jgi:hypothetical protein
VSAFTTRKIPENMTNHRTVMRSEVARDSSWPDAQRSWNATGRRCRCAYRSARIVASTWLAGPATSSRPQQDQPGFERAERQHAEDEPGEAAELAARDRAVDDRPRDQRDRQPREGGGERGDTAADQRGRGADGRRAAGGAARAGVGRTADRLP